MSSREFPMKTRHLVARIVLVSATLLSSHPAIAQFSQQGPRLVGTGAVGGREQGTSVSISADGNTAIVGGFPDNSSVGAAWVWTKSGGVWTQQSELVGSGAVPGASQGRSVSVSADGNTAIIGGPFDDNGVGAAWVWTRSGGVWTQQFTKLVGSGAVGGANQGLSVSISADGNTAIVGGPGDNRGAGASWVWTRSEGVWTQQGEKLVGSGAVNGQLGAAQGWSVALSGDGNTAVVGGFQDNSLVGAAWVFTRSEGVWTQQGKKLAGSGAAGPAAQGRSVSISADGSTAIVGGYDDNFHPFGGNGAAWVWARNGGAWTQQGTKLIGSDGVGQGEQGTSVSISADGNTAIVGGPFDNSVVGAAWIWTRSGGVWLQQFTKLVGSDAVGNANQGWSVSLSADGNTAIVGGPSDNGGAGAAWVFTKGTASPAGTPDLSITNSVVGGPPFLAGTNCNYIISVLNVGPGAANGVVVTDELPVGTTLVSATPSQGTCPPVPPSPFGTTIVSCALGSLANGASATISLTLTTGQTPGVVPNTAMVTAAEPDPNPGNNISTSTITTISPGPRHRAVAPH